jgi:ribosomal-protein-alanine N-acetyltransferase
LAEAVARVRLVLHPDAVAEATAAGDWYESQRPGLGADFAGEVEAPDQLVGSVSLRRGERENRGFWVGLPWQRRGLATEACAAANELWFEVLGFPVLRVGKAAANEPSRRISLREGMRLVGTEERDFVSGRLPAELWELAVDEWRARGRGR